MRLLTIFIIALMLVGLVSLSQTSLVQAKSENSGSGNSGKSLNSGQGGPSSQSDNSNKDNKGSGSSNQGSDKSADKSNSGKNLSITTTSSNRGQGSNSSGKNVSELKKGGKFLTESEVDLVATNSGKTKKLNSVKVTDATQAAQSKRRAVMGIITSVNGSELTLVHQIHTDRVFKVLLSSTTQIQSKNETATSSASLVSGIRVIVVGDLNSAGQLVASRIKVIPGKAIGVFNKFNSATGSGSTGTPSGSLTTPTPTATSSAEPGATSSGSL